MSCNWIGISDLILLIDYNGQTPQNGVTFYLINIATNAMPLNGQEQLLFLTAINGDMKSVVRKREIYKRL